MKGQIDRIRKSKKIHALVLKKKINHATINNQFFTEFRTPKRCAKVFDNSYKVPRITEGQDKDIQYLIKQKIL